VRGGRHLPVGVIYRDSGRLRHAVEYLERGLKLARANGWRYGVTVTLGRTDLQLGRLAEAHECCATALTINRSIGCRLAQATGLSYLGEIRHAQGHVDEAVDHLTAALPLFQPTR
jgi:tetratricopeptide (TPR) repeat protein